MLQTYVGELSEFLIGHIKTTLELTDMVYVEHGPSVTAEIPDTFALITIPQRIEDKGPWHQHNVRFEFVVKDLKSGRADVLKLQQMVNKLLSSFPINSGRFTLHSPYIRLKGSDGLGHTSWTVQCLCLVNTTDKYDLQEVEEENGVVQVAYELDILSIDEGREDDVAEALGEILGCSPEFAALGIATLPTTVMKYLLQQNSQEVVSKLEEAGAHILLHAPRD